MRMWLYECIYVVDNNMIGEEFELYVLFFMMILNIKVLDDKLSIEYIS